MSRPIITVFGATGAQGGGLARAILNDPSRRYALRAVTRKPEAAAAMELASRGADIVTADLDDARSVERALEGSQGAYFVTNFWEHFSADKELAQAKTLAAAAAQTGIRHVVWSTLEDTRQLLPADGARMPVLQGRFNVPHFDAKGEADHFFAQHRVPTTLLRTSFYWENLIYFGLGPKPEADGTLAIAMPMGTAKLPAIAVEDIGKAAFGILTRGQEFIGKTVGIAGEHLTGAEMAAALATALGRAVRYREVTPEQYRAFGFPGADELGNMFQFKRDFEREYVGARSLPLSRELNPGLQNFADWLARHKAKIPLA
jgi:uncharacterized protein YbjT (DUF2867 family)